MLGPLLFPQVPSEWQDRSALAGTSCTTWSRLRQLTVEARNACAPYGNQRVAISFAPSANSIALATALESLHCDVTLLDAEQSHDVALRICQHHRLATLIWTDPSKPNGDRVVDTFDSPRPATGNQTVTLLTSGTTGIPKAAQHTWSTLRKPVRDVPEHSGSHWLLSYRAHLYAGLQVMLQCFALGGKLVVPKNQATPDEIARLMSTEQVAFASATPSYWRQLAFFSDSSHLSHVPLRQITLGGEAIDQEILDRLHSIFPRARITHIYATTELGRCFAVHDGRAGFPASYLDQSPTEGIELRIIDSGLEVRSSNAMLGYDREVTAASFTDAEGWYRTGDMVELRGDRVHFVGRANDIINVGGNKVHPLVVEQTVRMLPSVSDVRVYGRASSVTGQIVACEIVLADGYDPDLVRREVARYCRDKLTAAQVPRLIEIVPSIAITSTGKRVRACEESDGSIGSNRTIQ